MLMYIPFFIFAIFFIIIVITQIVMVATKASKTTKMVADKVKEQLTGKDTLKEDSINKCEYCGSANKQGLTQCEHCGANLNNNKK